MKPVRIYLLVVTVLFTSNILQGQNTNNQEVIRNVYDELQNSKARSSITFDGMMKKEWGSILFEDLDFQNAKKNKVVVTGIVKGRQPSEC